MTNELRQKPSLAERVVEYAKTPFYIDRGFRRELIIGELYDVGIMPEMTVDGNICYRKGKGLPTTLFSSHIDVNPAFGLEPSKNYAEIIKTEGTTKVRGSLDNAVGVAINREIIERVKPKGTMWNVFSVEEEDYPGCKPQYGIERVCDGFESIGIRPDLGIALDITTSKNTNCKNADVYAENFSSRMLSKMMEEFIYKNNFNPYVKVRNKKSKDEATALGERYAAFSFGPGVYGEMHGVSTVNTDSLELSTQFLETIINSPEFIEKVSKENKAAVRDSKF